MAEVKVPTNRVADKVNNAATPEVQTGGEPKKSIAQQITQHADTVRQIEELFAKLPRMFKRGVLDGLKETIARKRKE